MYAHTTFVVRYLDRKRPGANKNQTGTTTTNIAIGGLSQITAMKKIIIAFALFLAGALALGGVNAFFAYTNTMEFCVSCHTMQGNYKELQETVHFKSASGVAPVCADCHVPKAFFPKIAAKIWAVKDIYHEIVGTVDTPEKFEAHKWEMANRVWTRMKETNSRECRSCHDFKNMDLSAQSRSARKQHARAPLKGKTCIDCHKGIAHHEPDEPDDAATTASENDEDSDKDEGDKAADDKSAAADTSDKANEK